MISRCTSLSGVLASCLPKQSLCLWIIQLGHYQWIIKGILQAYLSKNLWGCHLVVPLKWRAAYGGELQTCEHLEDGGLEAPTKWEGWELTPSGPIISTCMSISSSVLTESIYSVVWKNDGRPGQRRSAGLTIWIHIWLQTWSHNSTLF